MKHQENNFAYIDGANLHKGIGDLGWSLDYKRFRVWLRDKYSVKKAYIFLGLISKYKNLYTTLQEDGFTLIFKETVYDGDGKAKGNCDADLVLHTVCDAYEDNCEKAVLVSGDGDYACLVSFLQKKKKLKSILVPCWKKCSILLKRTGAPITVLSEFKNRFHKEKAPDADGTA